MGQRKYLNVEKSCALTTLKNKDAVIRLATDLTRLAIYDLKWAVARLPTWYYPTKKSKKTIVILHQGVMSKLFNNVCSKAY